MALMVNDVLQSAGFALIERNLISVIPGPLVAGVRVVPLVDPAIYVGAQLVAGYRTANQEVITVSAITGANFTANFANPHANGEPIMGATFPTGQIIQDLATAISPAAPVSPLFTQAEMLGYLNDVQNNFLELTRMIYAESQQALVQGQSIYNSPASAIRIERINIAGVTLWNVSQAELDMDSPSWQGVAGAGNPTQWFQDRLNTATFFLASPPPPVAPPAAKLWHSVKGTAVPGLADPLIVPDVFWPYLKYGVLSKAWGKDGETRDPRRATYSEKRFMRGVSYGVRLMQAIQTAIDFNQK